MKISYPFNVTNDDGSVLPATKAYLNINCSSYALEKEHADKLGVPRALKGTPLFKLLLEKCESVKWAYTVHRELYVTPENYGSHEVPHSIAAGNMPVFCAGIAKCNSGSVTVDNWTGHYRVAGVRAEEDIRLAWAGCGVDVHLGSMINNSSSSEQPGQSNAGATKP
jgi:hypothetical protein